MKETILKVKNLAVSYTTYRGKVKSVRGLSFKLKKGEALALVGESGCGKSASVKPIMGEHEANQVIESGEIIFTYDGPQGEETVDLLKIDDQKMQQEIKGKQIAMIFQDPMTSLDPTMKIGNQIAEAIKTSSHDLSSAELTDKVRELIDMVGIGHVDTVMNQYPHQLSGGMRQRIVIAIALSSDPSLLICDEPTTALDVTIQARILNLIKKLQRERGLSVIFITHNLGWLPMLLIGLTLCTRVKLLKLVVARIFSLIHDIHILGACYQRCLMSTIMKRSYQPLMGRFRT